MRKLATVALVLGLCCSSAAPVRADVKPHGLFTENMVLQHGVKVPVWGTADPGEQVRVEIKGTGFGIATGKQAGQDGKWLVYLDKLPPGGPYQMTIEGKNKIEFKNVLAGEVWVCGGQSNMEWGLNRTENAKDAIERSENPTIRLFTVQRTGAPAPQADLPSKKGVVSTWTECNPKTVGNFSAVGYYFGRDLQKALKVPVGLIHSSVGGTAAERWTTKETLAAYPETKNLKGSDLYNAMIAPLIPYAIKGVIWYQGESNGGRAAQYRTLFPAMIKNWRDEWKQGDFPFLFVQLAPVRTKADWAELREAQLLSLKVPHTAMAVITDAGHPTDIHPPKKEPVGARLALGARAIAYGEKIVYSGPIYSGMKVDGDKVILNFQHLGGGLEAKGGALTGFTIAGADGKFVNAEATIVKDTVVVRSPDVAQPTAVRFGWSSYPEVNLFNREGLPASPFRTDGPATK
jgi:sialate O-acetylesterase